MFGIVIWATRIQERFRHAALVDAHRRLVLRQYVGVQGKRYILIVHHSVCRTEIRYLGTVVTSLENQEESMPHRSPFSLFMRLTNPIKQSVVVQKRLPFVVSAVQSGLAHRTRLRSGSGGSRCVSTPDGTVRCS